MVNVLGDGTSAYQLIRIGLGSLDVAEQLVNMQKVLVGHRLWAL